jgi:hypothetical protein
VTLEKLNSTPESTIYNALICKDFSRGRELLGVDINNRGNILGYSFLGKENIGAWDRNGKFKLYFVEGTPEFPTTSRSLVFNDNNLIVITWVEKPVSEIGTSYLVPKPGIRLNLADLVVNLPPGQKLYVQDINNHGDILGTDFVLQRVGPAE